MTARPAFSRTVTEPRWHDEARSWIVAALAGHGIAVTGEITQPRVRPWSTQLLVPTDAGRVWFKADAPAVGWEAALHETLARLLPDDVDRPLATDPDRCWVLTRDRGATLGETRTPTQADWCRVVSRAAALQQRLAGHRAELLATGLPDGGPDRVVGLFDRLLEIFSGLPPDHPAHVDAAMAATFAAARPRLVDAAATLAASVLPATWDHGDLHPWNVFDTGDGLRLFDFGDGLWAHAAEVLSIPRGWVADRDDLRWEPVEEAYCTAWGLRAADLRPVLEAAALTHPVNRSVTWWWCLRDATAEEWARWGAAPRYHLTGVLEGA